MTGRKRIEKYDRFGLQLTQVERKLIVERVAGLPEGIAQTIQRTPAKQPIRMTLDDWKELAGHIASEANDTGDKKLQERLDGVFAKIDDLLERHDVEEPSLVIKPPLTEESVQLAEWAATILIGAENLGIKSKIVTQFPLPGAQRSVLMRLPITSANLRAKLAEDAPLLTVGEVGGLLIAVSEALLDATPLQQFAQILTAKSLKECLEAEVATAMKSGGEGPL